MVSRLLRKTILDKYVDGMTIPDICDKYGVSEKDAIAAIRESLSQEDIFTDIENRRLSIYKLRSLLARAESFIDITDIKTAPALLKEAHSLVKSISELQDKQEAISEEEAKKVAFQQATLLVQVVQASYQRARELLSNEFPDVDLELVDSAFNEGLKQIAASYTS